MSTTIENAELSIEEIRTKVEGLLKRHKIASDKRNTYMGLLAAKREELANLKKEIEAAGLDPKRLKEKKAETQAELLRLMSTLDERLTSVEEAFASFEERK